MKSAETKGAVIIFLRLVALRTLVQPKHSRYLSVSVNTLSRVSKSISSVFLTKCTSHTRAYAVDHVVRLSGDGDSVISITVPEY